MQSPLLHSLLFVALAGGCAGTGQLTYASDATVPQFVAISPGVRVIADLDEPIFYSDNYYWRNQGGFWYRSTYHTHGWARVDVAPVAIRNIERPSAYAHYHGEARASVSGERRAPPAPRVDVRDHREVVAPPQHRDDRHDDDRRGADDKRHDDKRHDDKRHDDKHHDDDDRRDGDKHHD